MSDVLADLGLSEPEPDTSLMAFLRANPEFIPVCKEHGWWSETIAMLEESNA
jgi:hypothetical protein